MYYIIHFEFIDNEKYLNITKFNNENDAINRLIYQFFNSIIARNPQRHLENPEYILKCLCFDHNIDELLEKYKKNFTKEENIIFNKIKEYKKLYICNSKYEISYFYIEKMYDNDLVLDYYDFDKLKSIFKIKEYKYEKRIKINNLNENEFFSFTNDNTIYKIIIKNKKERHSRENGWYNNITYENINNNILTKRHFYNNNNTFVIKYKYC